MALESCVSRYKEIRRVLSSEGTIIIVEWNSPGAHPMITVNCGVFIDDIRYLVIDVIMPSERDPELALASNEVGFLVMEVKSTAPQN